VFSHLKQHLKRKFVRHVVTAAELVWFSLFTGCLVNTQLFGLCKALSMSQVKSQRVINDLVCMSGSISSAFFQPFCRHVYRECDALPSFSARRLYHRITYKHVLMRAWRYWSTDFVDSFKICLFTLPAHGDPHNTVLTSPSAFFSEVYVSRRIPSSRQDKIAFGNTFKQNKLWWNSSFLLVK